MKVYKYLLLSFFIGMYCGPVTGTIWTTANYGSWNNPACWIGNNIPPYNNSDTIQINHPLVIDADIFLQPGSYLVIDTLGGICGHNIMFVAPGAKVYNYGILELDVLNIPGGQVYGYHGNIILTAYGTISNGGSLLMNGGGMTVGPWFDCIMPQYSFLTSSGNEIKTGNIKIFPNPASTDLYIDAEDTIKYIVITDVTGRSRLIYYSNINNAFSLSGINPGMYMTSVFDMKNKLMGSQKILITH